MRTAILSTSLLILLVLGGCVVPPGDVGTEIVSAREALDLLSHDTVLVDARGLLDYRKGHIDGAVSISRADIVVNEPFVNLLAPPDQIEDVLGSRGITNDTLVVIYDDNNNMDSARLWWTLKVYGHDLVKVISGGLEALRRAGAEESTSAPLVEPEVFTAAAVRTDWIATQSDLRSQVNEPDPDTVIVDTRSIEEYNEGTIPGSICLDYAGNNYSDGTFRVPRQIQIRYIQAGLDFDQDAILYCKTSIRGAQTFLALYDAGYRDLKLYDAAWVEWSANPMNEIYVPEVPGIVIEASDAS